MLGTSGSILPVNIHHCQRFTVCPPNGWTQPISPPQMDTAGQASSGTRRVRCNALLAGSPPLVTHELETCMCVVSRLARKSQDSIEMRENRR